MAKLIIYQGEALEREIELGERNVRIGRAEDNDIVLTDPTKSISRRHAEVRFDQGKYIVVDRESQNGLWLAGRRVPETTLAPGVPVVMGSFKLVLKDDRPAATPDGATMLLSPNPADAATLFIPRPASIAPPPAPNVQPSKPAAAPEAKAEPKPAPVAEAKPEPKPAPVAEAKAEPKPAPPPEVKPKPSPPPAVAAPRPQPPPPPPAPPPPPPAPAAASAPAKPAGKGLSKTVVFGGVAAALVAVVAGAAFLTPVGRQLVDRMRSKPAPPAAAAATTAAPPPVTPAPAARPVAKNPTPPPAAAPPNPAPRPAARAAREENKPANAEPPVAAVAAPPRPPRAARGRAATAPEDKPAPAPVEKPLDLAATFEQARSATIKGDYLAAIAGFEAILKVDANYPNAANLLGVARGGAKNASQLAVDSGNKAEMGGDYVAAAKEYDRALQLDPQSTAAPDAIRRLKARMQLEGEATFTQATQYDALGRKQDAITKYERAIQLLPPDHANVKTARERLTALKGGN